jgi:hypothetical protein
MEHPNMGKLFYLGFFKKAQNLWCCTCLLGTTLKKWNGEKGRREKRGEKVP